MNFIGLNNMINIIMKITNIISTIINTSAIILRINNNIVINIMNIIIAILADNIIIVVFSYHFDYYYYSYHIYLPQVFWPTMLFLIARPSPNCGFCHQTMI